MKWIDSTDLRAWANRRSCQDTLPLLTRKLIRATAKSIKNIKFPAGDNVQLGGWDGILEVPEGTEYIPDGISLWEFGAGNNPKGKADDDYEKRTAKPNGYNPKDSTFVFVTPRIWTGADEWVKARMAEGKWKDIKVYNSEQLEEWIDEAPTVGAWLATKHLGKYPDGGIQSTEDYWDEWSAGPKFKLIPELLVAGRSTQKDKLIELYKEPAIITVQALSRDEALAFIAASFKSDSQVEEDFFSRSIIVNTVEAFRELAVMDKPLILIPRFEDAEGVINRAKQKGHLVIIPTGVGSVDGIGTIKLPPIEREGFVSALVSMGITKEQAEKLSRESARNLTILRRRWEFTKSTPAWALAENVSEIIPALILGRWNEDSEKDRDLVSRIAGESYENYSKKLMRWRFTQDPPIIKIGSRWRLISPLDAWAYAAKSLTRNDFELLRKYAVEVLSQVDSQLRMSPAERLVASMRNKEPEFSGWIAEGIVQSLILTSIVGDTLMFDLPTRAETWVDGVVAELLKNEDPAFWQSVDRKLPLIAEASPVSFLSSVEVLLGKKSSPICSLFEETEGFLMPESHHTGILWALEKTAWLPEHFAKSALLLAKLAAIDPGGKLSNRPINSLKEIFKPWHYQTLATLDVRIEVLKLILDRESNVAWTTLIRMLPEGTSDVATPTQKPRWRLFDVDLDRPITYQEIFDTHSAVVDLLISAFDFSEEKYSKLIEESVSLSPMDREKLISFIESASDKVVHTANLAWEKCRNILYHHRSYPNAEWALPETDLTRYEKLYDSLIPLDDIQREIWVFDDHWPRLTIGYRHKEESREKREETLMSVRVTALKNIYSKYGIDKVLELSRSVKEPWYFGAAVAQVIVTEPEIIAVCLSLKDTGDQRFGYGFLHQKSVMHSLEWVFELFGKLQAHGMPSQSLTRILMPLQQGKKLWSFVEMLEDNVQTEYWMNVNPHFWAANNDDKVYGINKLISYKRYFTAMDVASHFTDDLPIELIASIMEKAATDETGEPINIQSYPVTQLFEAIDKNGTLDKQRLINIEWMYLPLLASYGTARSPKILHETLSNDPSFFVEVLKWAYKPDNDEQLKKEKLEAGEKGVSEEQISNRSMQAYQLFQSWKNVPGADASGKINGEALRSWVDKARAEATKIFRGEMADITIAKVLAAHLPKGENWPPEEISSLIERINSESLIQAFSSGVFNQFGSSSRRAFDGGDIERNKASYFDKIAQARKSKFPAVAHVFEKLSAWYLEDAKRMDDSAEIDRLEY